MKTTFAVGLIVVNQFGVLNRISALISKRGYNIISITAGETENPRFTRLTMVINGDQYVRDQVVKQLRKLHDVRIVHLFSAQTIQREHSLIKLKNHPLKQADTQHLVDKYGAVVMENGDSHLLISAVLSCQQMNELVKFCRKIGILELCRSGAVAMTTGAYCDLSLNNISKGELCYVKNVL